MGGGVCDSLNFSSKPDRNMLKSPEILGSQGLV